MPRKHGPVIASTETGATPDAQVAPPETLLQQIQRMSPDEWQGKKVYVYRVWPIIDKKADDHFLAKLSEAFDEDDLLKNWGTGRYHLRLNGPRGEALASQTVAIHNPDHPPKLDPLEVVESDPRNKVFFDVWGPRAGKEQPGTPADGSAVQELSKLASKVLDQRTGAPGQQANGISDATTALLLGMSKGRDELAEKLASVAGTPSGDPIAALDRAVELLKKLRPEDSRAAALDPVSALDRAVELVKKLQPAASNEPERKPTEQVSEVLDLYAKLRENFGGGGAPEQGTDMRSVAAIVHEVSELLKNPLAIAMQVWAGSKSRTPTGALPGAPLAQPQPRPAEAQPGPPHAQAAQPDTATAPGPPPDGIIVMANAITPVMLKYLHADAPGGEMGAEFAGWVSDGWGMEDLRTLQGLGAEAIVGLYRQSPFWAVLAPMEAKFHEFVGAFVQWRSTGDEDEPDSRDTGEHDVLDLTAGA